MKPRKSVKEQGNRISRYRLRRVLIGLKKKDKRYEKEVVISLEEEIELSFS